MTEEQVINWKKERDIARRIADDTSRHEALQEVYDHRDDMMMHCIQRQADRVKMILKDHDDMVATHKDYQQERAEREGVRKALNWVKWGATVLGSCGAGAIVTKWIGG